MRSRNFPGAYQTFEAVQNPDLTLHSAASAAIGGRYTPNEQERHWKI